MHSRPCGCLLKKDNFTITNRIIFQELFTAQWVSKETEGWCFELGIDLLLHQNTEDPMIMTLEMIGVDNSIMFMQSYYYIKEVCTAITLGMLFWEWVNSCRSCFSPFEISSCSAQ